MNPNRATFPLRLALTMLGCAASLPALATEAGVDNIGTGTDGFFMLPLEVDSLPENMVAFNLYYNHYKSRKLNISSLGGKVPNVEIESTAVIPRLDYLSPVRVFGGRLAGYIAQPWLKQEVSVFWKSPCPPANTASIGWPTPATTFTPTNRCSPSPGCRRTKPRCR
jgi:hypothetical protein